MIKKTKLEFIMYLKDLGFITTRDSVDSTDFGKPFGKSSDPSRLFYLQDNKSVHSF